MAVITLTSRNKVKSRFLGRVCSLAGRNWKRSEFQEAGTPKGPQEDIPQVNSPWLKETASHLREITDKYQRWAKVPALKEVTNHIINYTDGAYGSLSLHQHHQLAVFSQISSLLVFRCQFKYHVF